MKKIKKIAAGWMCLLFLMCLSSLFWGIPCQAEEKGVIYKDASGMNSWWCYPLSVTWEKKKIFTTYTTAEGYCGVMERNLQNGKVRRINLAKFAVDDHNAGAVELLEDGRILYIVTGHSEKKYLEIFISKKSGDISHWKKRRLKTEGWVTYAQIVRTEKGYFLFTRERWNDKLENGKKESHWCWLVSFSRDGENWKDPCRLIDSGKHQYYLKAVPCTDSTDIRLIMYAHPNLNSSAIRQAFFNIDTWEVSSTKGKVLGKAEAGGTGVDNKTVPKILERNQRRRRILDVGKTEKEQAWISFAEFDDETNVKYKVGVYSKKTKNMNLYDVTMSGEAFYARSRYFGGMCFDTENPRTLYLSRKEGDFWYIEKWHYEKKQYVFKRVIKKSRKNLIRPFAAEYGGKLQWIEGTYARDSFKTFETMIATKKIKK